MAIKVLCVDDELIWRKIVQRHFQDFLTQNVDLAEDYASGIEKIRQTRYDLIVLDSLEGNCFRLYGDMKDIPHGDVVILSGNEIVEKEAKRLGIPYYSKSKATEGLDTLATKYKPAANL
jgi:DNA-binding response OmpR family regulator